MGSEAIAIAIAMRAQGIIIFGKIQLVGEKLVTNMGGVSRRNFTFLTSMFS